MFKFIIWWWNRLDHVVQAVVSIVLPTLIIGIAIVTAGPAGLFGLGSTSLFLILLPAVSVFSYIAARGISGSLRADYAIYRKEYPTEAERIISKLKGV